MNEQEFDRKMAEYVDLIRQKLEACLQEGRESLQSEIFDAMEYCLLAPGKRIRPVMTLAFAELFGVPAETALPYAAALEMIHTYSLVHDDLPCMDDDDLRRGRPTCHKVFGEANAVLCGDALLNRAFETVLTAASKDGIPGAAAGRELARLAGAEGMIGGQVIDLKLEGKQASAEELFSMYALKTGALLEAPARIASELGRELMPADRHGLTSAFALQYCRALGLAFQVKDDILDVVGDTALLGKNVGSDAKDDKNTIVTLVGVEEAQRIVKEQTDRAAAAADALGPAGEFLKLLALRLLTRMN